MREIVLDTETTGFDPVSGDRIVEIGCVELKNCIPTGNVYHVYINPERDMPQSAFEVHGLSEEFLKEHPVFSSVVEDFLEFLAEDPLVIHNAKFDMKFINHELKMVGKPAIPMSRTVDTLLMARKKFPGSPASLDALCRRFKIDNSSREKHGALLDSELLAEVYLELMGGRQKDFGLVTESDTAVGGIHEYQYGNQSVPHRTFSVPQQEQEAHKKHLEDIEDPIWEKIKAS